MWRGYCLYANPVGNNWLPRADLGRAHALSSKSGKRTELVGCKKAAIEKISSLDGAVTGRLTRRVFER